MDAYSARLGRLAVLPRAFDQPDEKGVEWVRHPEIMKKIKEARDTSNPR